MPFRRIKGILLVMAAALALLSGCSSTDNFEEPAPVPEAVSDVRLKEIWSRQIGDGHDEQLLYLQPLVVGDTTYAASADGELLAVATGSGKVLWDRDLDLSLMAGVGGDPAHLYVVSEDAELIALSRESGDQIWSSGLPSEVLSVPRSNGSLVVVQTIDGKAHGFNASSGEKLWQFDSSVPVLSMRVAASPLVGGDITLASFANGRLLALSNETGRPVWQYQVGSPEGRTELERLVDIAGEPLIIDAGALVVGYNGKLAYVDLQTGREIWSRPASSLNSPMVGDGRIFYAAANGDLIALNASDRKEAWRQDQLSWRRLNQPMVVGNHLVVADFEGVIHVLTLDSGVFVGQKSFDDEGIRTPFQRLPDDRFMVFGNDGELAVFELKAAD